MSGGDEREKGRGATREGESHVSDCEGQKEGWREGRQ